MKGFRKYLSLLLLISMGTFSVPRYFLHQCAEAASPETEHHHDLPEASFHEDCFACDVDIKLSQASSPVILSLPHIHNPHTPLLVERHEPGAIPFPTPLRGPPAA